MIRIYTKLYTNNKIVKDETMSEFRNDSVGL